MGSGDFQWRLGTALLTALGAPNLPPAVSGDISQQMPGVVEAEAVAVNLLWLWIFFFPPLPGDNLYVLSELSPSFLPFSCPRLLHAIERVLPENPMDPSGRQKWSEDMPDRMTRFFECQKACQEIYKIEPQ